MILIMYVMSFFYFVFLIYVLSVVCVKENNLEWSYLSIVLCFIVWYYVGNELFK